MYGKVTTVKNQGQCGSCWAFSAAEQVESAWAMAGNALWEFSPQQIASCTKNCFGCGGGDTPAAYNYINSTIGLGSVGVQFSSLLLKLQYLVI
jgi:C1A family cysteine protease